MLRLRIAHRFGLLTPLLRLQRWADGHEGVMYPGADAHVLPQQRT